MPQPCGALNDPSRSGRESKRHAWTTSAPAREASAIERRLTRNSRILVRKLLITWSVQFQLLKENAHGSTASSRYPHLGRPFNHRRRDWTPLLPGALRLDERR